MALTNGTKEAEHERLTLRAYPLAIDIEQQDEVCVLRCKGRFVAGLDLDYMRTKMDDIKQLNCSKVLADFREVTSIGSAGLAFILGVYTSVVREQGGCFVLAGAVPLVNRVFELTRLSTLIPLVADLTSGLAALRGEAAAASTGRNG